ncbi:MAG: 50S ribosomal protein L11 methyltransferase, partial [Cyanobacteria bacterium P01_H01_bin.15]
PSGAGAQPVISSPRQGFAKSVIHRKMLNDKTRTGQYLAAIRSIVTAADTVVDLGSGTGVLAIAAAQAGAKRVYAIESSSIVGVAHQAVHANQVAERVSIIQGWSVKVDLPEPAQVLVTETIGDPLSEGILPLVLDARKRWLSPDARIIPARLAVHVEPVTLPETANLRILDEELSRWRQWYEQDLTPLQSWEKTYPASHYLKWSQVREWPSLGTPLRVAHFDFKTFVDASGETTTEGVFQAAGRLDALLVSFDAELAPQIHIRTHRGQVDETNHWLYWVWVLPAFHQVQPGDRFKVTFRYGQGLSAQQSPFDVTVVPAS